MESLNPNPAVARTAPTMTANPPNGRAESPEVRDCVMVGCVSLTICIVPDAP